MYIVGYKIHTISETDGNILNLSDVIIDSDQKGAVLWMNVMSCSVSCPGRSCNLQQMDRFISNLVSCTLSITKTPALTNALAYYKNCMGFYLISNHICTFKAHTTVDLLVLTDLGDLTQIGLFQCLYYSVCLFFGSVVCQWCLLDPGWCHLCKKSTCQFQIKHITSDYLQMYKTLRLFTNTFTFNTNTFASVKVLIKTTYVQIQSY